MPHRLESVNDFVIKFANVNGSGSASANTLFAKSIIRMGVPVSPRNIFPSNIQGLPTWYEVRVSEEGHLGRRGGVDLMVAMNPQTWDQDMAEIEPGGYLFYDSTRPISRDKFRNDINILGMPLTQICNERYSDPRQRQLFKNIIYVGALAALLGIEEAVLERLVGEQYKGKEKLLEPNMQALRAGKEFVEQNLPHGTGLSVERRDAVGEQVFIDGNSATALGCVYAGATVAAWYPITPSTSVAEAFQKYCQKLRIDESSGKALFAIVQAEDEIAAVGIVLGANWNGARAFTATSGPGVSLMQEFIGLAYFGEVPLVIVDVQRGGPSTGMPTRTQQADLLLCAYASHGDTKHVMLFPHDPSECFEFAAQAFDLAERLQTPVFLMSDLDIGMNDWLSAPFTWDDSRTPDRGKVVTYDQLEGGFDFGRYLDVDGDGIPYRTIPSTHPSKGAYVTRGSSKDSRARYSEAGKDYVENVTRLSRKLNTAREMVPAADVKAAAGPTKTGVLFFGSTAPSMREALDQLAPNGIHLDAMRIRGFPFGDEVKKFLDSHESVIVVEQNRDGQMRRLLVTECEADPAKLIGVVHFDGTPITARFIVKEISEIMRPLAALEHAGA